MTQVSDIIEIDPYLQVWAKDQFLKQDPFSFAGTGTRLDIIKTRIKTDPEDEQQIETPSALPELQNSEKPTIVVLNQTYTNNTESEIVKEFLIERETTAKVSTSLEKGYHCPGLPNIVLKIPDAVRSDTAGSGPNPVLKMVESQETNDVAHKIKFSSKTTVPVPGGKTYTASVKLKEVSKSFVSKANIRFRGTVVARKVDVATGDEIPMTIKVEDLFKQIKESQINRNSVYGELPKIPVIEKKGHVYWPIESRVVFNYLIGEETEVNDPSM